jgi:formamidopyrimidine-DNA glycosylase
MPELPEVETIRLGLQKHLVGHKIVDVDIRLPRIFSGDSRKIIGGKIIAARRFGKGLLIDLDNGYSIAVHVKMTGQLLYKEVSRVPQVSRVPRAKVDVKMLPDAYTHVVFSLDKGSFLYFRDMRQFGWVKNLSTKDAKILPFFKSLGPEPLKDLTREKFKAILSRNKTTIKVLLMDQKKISGIGNIYANDALFVAGIDPRRYSASLTQTEQAKLFEAIEQVLKKGLEAGGASEWSYVDVLGGSGSYQNFFQVYGMRGLPCKNCGTIIEKITLGGRGTFFCPKCQK